MHWCAAPSRYPLSHPPPMRPALRTGHVGACIHCQASSCLPLHAPLQVERGMLNGHGSLAFSVTLRPDDEQCDAAVEVVDLGHEHNGAAGKDATVAAKAVAAQVAAAHGGHRHRDGSADVVLVAPTKTR